MIRECKGITLVSLVITIMVFGIIIGVTILTSTGSNIVGEAKQSANDFNNASIKQILDSIYLSERNKYTNGLISEDQMWANIVNNIESNTTESFEVEVVATDEIKVKVNGEAMYKITTENGVEAIK